MGTRPNVVAALSQTVALRRFPYVVAIFAVPLLVSATGMGPVQAIASLVTFVILGYTVTYSRSVAAGDASLPGFEGIDVFIRRTLGMTVALSVAGLATLVVLTPLSVLMNWGLSRFFASSATTTAYSAGAFVDPVILTLLIVLLAPVGIAYVQHDNVKDALRIPTAMKLAWANRRAIAAPVVVTVGIELVTWYTSSAYASNLDGPALGPLPIGHLSAGSVIAVGATLLLVIGLIIAMFVQAHLVGQYCAIAYRDEANAPGSSA